LIQSFQESSDKGCLWPNAMIATGRQSLERLCAGFMRCGVFAEN
jgi:hypothetical protein